MEDFDNPEVGQLLEAPSAPKPEPFENSEVNALVDPEWQHRQLERKRQEYAGEEQSLLKRGVLSSVPFASAIAQTVSNQHYGAAKEKFAQGTANEQDIDIMAEWERRHQEEGNRSLGGKIGSALLGVPAIAGEAMATPFSLPVRGAGGFILNKAIQAQLMPSMTLQHASQRAAEQGGSTFDPQNLAPAAAFSAVQNMVLGSLGHVASGIENPAARFLAKTAAGVGEMQGANVLAGAVDEILPEAYQTKTRYGAIGSFLRGEAGDAARQLAVDTVTMAAFTALHGNPGHGKELVEAVKEAVDDGHKRGFSADAAVSRLDRIMGAAKKPGAVKADIPISELKDGPLKTLGELVAKTLPDAVALPDQGIVRAVYADKPITLKMDPDGTVDVSFKHDPRSGKVGIAEEQPNSAAMGFGRKLLGLVKGLGEAGVSLKYQTLDESGQFDTDKARSYASALTRAGYERVAEPADGDPGGFHVWKPKAEAPEAPTPAPGASGSRPGPSAEAPPAPEAPGDVNLKRQFLEAMRLNPKRMSDAKVESEAKRLRFDEFQARQEPQRPEAPPEGPSVAEEAGAKQSQESETQRSARLDEADKQYAANERGLIGLSVGELQQRHDAAVASERATDARILGGVEGVRRYKRLHREAESDDPAKAKAAEREIAAIEKKLTPAQLDALNGVGLTEPTADTVKTYLDAKRDVFAQTDTAEELGQSLKFLLPKIPPFDSKPETWDASQRAAMAALIQVKEVIAERGFSPQEVMEAAVEAAAGRFRDKYDAYYTLSRFLSKGTPKRSGRQPAISERGRLALPAAEVSTEPSSPESPDPLAEAYRNKGITKRDQDIHQRLINGESGEAIAQSHRMTRSRVNQIKDEVDAKVGAGLTVEDRQQEMALQRAEVAKAQGRVRNTATSEQAQAEQAPVDESEPKADIGKLSNLIKEQFDEGNRQKTRWHVERMRQILLDNWFTPEEVDAAFSAHKMPPRGKAPGEPGGGRVRGANAQRNSEAFDYYLKRAFMDALAPKEMADVKSAGKAEHVSDAEVRRRVASAYEEALRFSDRQIASETGAEAGHTGDAGDFNPAELESPARVERLMKMGYSRKAAEERAARESAYQHPTAMGAAAVGELTQEAPQDPILVSLAHADSAESRQAMGMAAEAKRQKYPDDQVMAAAKALIHADPDLPNKIIADLEKKNRPTTVVETAVLEMERTRLANEVDAERWILKNRVGELGTEAELKERLRAVEAQEERLLNVTDPAGSEAGAAFRLRQALMEEDFTLAGMRRRAEKAKGSPLTDKEVAELETLRDRLRAAEADVEKAREAGKPDYSNARPSMSVAKVAEVKKDARSRIQRFEDENKPWWAKALDKMLEVQRFSILSGGQTIEKLSAAAGVRVILAPIRQAVAGALGKLPFIRQVAEKSPRWGRISPKAEVEAITTGLWTGLKAAKERSPFGSGQSAADVAYGEGKYARKPGVAGRILNAPGEVHGALKAVPFENEFARSARMREEFYRKRGMATDTPSAQERIGKEAYHDAEEATFQRGPGDWLADKFNDMVSDLKKKDKEGQYPFLRYLGGTAVKSRAPIVRVPLNIVGESLRGIFGTLTGSAGVADAIAKGVKNLPPERADLIMKRLTDGTIGAAFLTLGAMGYARMGGLHVEGDRRKKKLGEGQAEVFGVTLPKEVLHDPRLQLMQAGATAVQQAQRNVKGEPLGKLAGAGAAVGATLREVPFVRDFEQTNQALAPNTQAHATAEMVKSLALPQLVQWLARELDKPHPFSPAEQPTPRKAETFWENVKLGIPGQREKLKKK